MIRYIFLVALLLLNINQLFAEGETNKKNLIDLGLPSGLLWMDYNYGASNSHDFGEYCLGSDNTSLQSSLEKGFSIPSKDQFQELFDNTTQTWTEVSGVKGMLFKATNGNSIFLPAAAQLWYNTKEGDGFWDINNEGSGAYWTSTPSNYEQYIYFVEFNEKDGAFFGDRKQSDNRLPIRLIYYNPNSSVISVDDASDKLEVYTFNNSISIKLADGLSFDFALFDITGQLIKNNAASGNISIDGLSKGVYILKVKSNNKCRSYKIVI